jgi:hypothetical protein
MIGRLSIGYWLTVDVCVFVMMSGMQMGVLLSKCLVLSCHSL